MPNKSAGKAARRSSASALPAPLIQALPQGCSAPEQLELLRRFLDERGYNPKLALRLIAAGRGANGESWAFRRLAAWMLQALVLRIPPDALAEHDAIFVELGIKRSPGLDRPVAGEALKLGYTSTALAEFTGEFHRKLGRSAPYFERLNGLKTSADAWAQFVRAGTRDCKAILARHLFTPREVVKEAMQLLRTSLGVPKAYPECQLYAEREAARAVNHLPAYEAEILTRLRDASRVYWVCDETPSEINSLVEYPLGTIVLVVKPPGSEIEFELKRAGMRGPRLLDVVFERDGWELPASHRLQGGARGWSLQWEAYTSASLARQHRLVHGVEAPMSTMISVHSIHEVPHNGTDHQVLDYFWKEEAFGEGFAQMREAMRRSIKAFKKELGLYLEDVSGELGQTLRFHNQVSPASGILSGTSSFRVDRMAEYLSADGASIYFEKGLKRGFTPAEAQAFADELLEEALGEFVRPKGAFEDYESYLEAVFAQPSNRARADQVYLGLIEQIAHFWGTLLALRGYSNGESFVARNTGVKARWEQGQWKVRLIFMDHDDLYLPGRGQEFFFPKGALSGMSSDAKFILANPEDPALPKGQVFLLTKLYRIGEETAETARMTFYDALKKGYQATQRAQRENPDLQRFYHPGYLTRLRDWDEAAAIYLKDRTENGWAAPVRALLAKKGYKDGLIKGHVEMIGEYRAFIEQFAILYLSQ